VFDISKDVWVIHHTFHILLLDVVFDFGARDEYIGVFWTQLLLSNIVLLLAKLYWGHQNTDIRSLALERTRIHHDCSDLDLLVLQLVPSLHNSPQFSDRHYKLDLRASDVPAPNQPIRALLPTELRVQASQPLLQ